MRVFTKQFKILGRSKKLILITDAIFIILFAFSLSYLTNYHIKKLQIKPIIINAINQISNINKSDAETIIKEKIETECSKIKLNSYAMYYNTFGDQIGIGPIPPIIGIPTNYWIFFEIESANNNLQNIILYTHLGKNVNITKNKNITSGNFTINQNKQITWAIQNIERNQIIKLVFEVSFVPDENNIGQIASIIENTKIVADDEICKKQISAFGENLDTDLKYDIYAKNQGMIEK
ncbi:MAG: hypothetical protein PHH83_00155 [Patescibacteria group bacterium]|nr:hypothetical protein [Patescibacteria group bacterium]